MTETTAALLLMIAPSYAAERPAICKPFSAIYTDGRTLCENMWDGAFRYETKEEEAYTMWFFDDNNNPNDAITETLTNLGLITGSLPGGKLDQCYLAYFHKDGSQHIDNGEHPTEEPGNFQECHPWSERSCCFQDTVDTADKLNKAYGPGYHWDRCGPLSPACERFFVQEACFYECEPNIGLYRKYVAQGQPHYKGGDAETYNPACDPYALEYDASLACDHNTWQVSGMPIKASYCDAWFLACRDDYFCAHDDGSYFSCAEEYEENNPPFEEGQTASPTAVAFPSVAPNESSDKDKMFSSTELAITAVVCFFGAVAFTVVFMTIAKKTQETSMRSREDSVRSDKSNDSNSELMGKEKDGKMDIELFEQAVIVRQASV
jgi:folate receptor